MTSPLVTVVVPLYNKGRLVLRALESIRAQTFGDLEVLVVDDGSSDEGPELAAGFPDPRFRVLRKLNGGPGSARNFGLAGARSQFTAFLDADDAWRPDFLAAAVDSFERMPEASSTACACLERTGSVSSTIDWAGRGLTSELFRLTPQTPVGRMVAALAFMSPCSTVSRTSDLRRCGGFYEGNRCVYGEDAFLYLKILLTGAVFLDLTPRVEVYRDASQLSGNLRSVRPVEPFLEHPDLVRADCPAPLRPLLEDFLATRACKTACVLGYWGEWQRAIELRSRFATSPQLPYYLPSLAAATPLGSLAGLLHRRLLKSA